MDHSDEQIVEMRRDWEKRNLATLEDGTIVKGMHLEFAPCSLFDEKMSIMLPTSFVNMPYKIARIKYPSEQRPKVIKTNLIGSTNFAFTLYEQPIKKTQLKSTTEKIKDVIRSVNPANVFFRFEEEENNDVPLCWFDFKGYAVDAQTYNIFYFAIINNKLLHGIFNCLDEDMKDWKDTAFKVIHSIKDTSGGESNA